MSMTSTQNIERELHFLKRYPQEAQEAERYTSVVLANQGTPSSSLQLALTPVVRYASVALESATVHRLFTIAEGSDTLHARLDHREGAATTNVVLPHGQYDAQGLASMLQHRLNDALLRMAEEAPAAFLRDTTAYMRVLCAGEGIAVAPELSTTTRFSYKDGNLPLADIVAFAREQPDAVCFITATDDISFSVTRVSVADTAGLRTEYLEQESTLVVCPFNMTQSFGTPQLEAFELPGEECLAAADGSGIPEGKRGTFEYCTKCDPRVPATHLRMAVLCAAIRAQQEVYVVEYKYGDVTYVRVTNVQGARATASIPNVTAVFKAHCTPSPKALSAPWSDLATDPANPMNAAGVEFVVRSGLDLAKDIVDRGAQPVYELPVMAPPGQVPTDWSSPAALNQILPETHLLARMYVDMFPSTHAQADRFAHHRLLARIQTDPARFGNLTKDMLAVWLRPTYEAPGMFQPLLEARYGLVPRFTLSGSAARVLGLGDSATGRDPTAGLLPRLDFINPPPLVTFTGAWGRPIGMGVDGGVQTPQRLVVHATLNGNRIMGNVHGGRPLAVVPFRKAYNDIWEPVMTVSAPLGAPAETIGLVVENEAGVPVTGEYTFVLRLK